MIRAVFLISNIATWDALSGIYERMKISTDFAPIIVTVPAINYDDAAHTAFDAVGIPHISLGSTTNDLRQLIDMHPDILFRQTPHDDTNDIPKAFYTENLKFTRLIYTDYGLGILNDKDVEKPEKKEDATGIGSIWVDYDQELHRRAWLLVCANDDQKKIYETASHKGENAVVTGYPKFERLIYRKQSEKEFWPIAEPRQRFRLIWHPHHSLPPSWVGFGMFREVYKDMLRWASDRSIEIVLEPHPALFPHYVDIDPEFKDFIAEWTALKNTAIYHGDFVPLMLASDAMVTDGISFLAEYQIFDKPLIWLDSGRHLPFNVIGEQVIKGVYPARTVSDVIQLVAAQFGGDPLARQRRETVRYLTRPNSAENVLAAIREKMS